MGRLIGFLLLFAGIGVGVYALWPNLSAVWSNLSVDRSSPVTDSSTRVDRPNVLVITMDTTRFDRIGANGSDVETPALDALAERGVRFTDAYTAAPVTLPSHSTMFTGRYPYEHGVRNNGQFRLPDKELTLAEILGNAGYETAAFVSAQVLERRYGLDQGFELYDDDLSERLDTPQFAVPTRRGGITVDHALEWLRQRDTDQPFFAWVHLYDPHSIYDPPQPFRSRYQGRLYDGEIAYMDSHIGRLLDYLSETGLESDTVVLALADHGEGLGEHGERTHGLLVYDATMHVPFILAGPGVKTGAVSGRLVSTADVLPSLLDLAGVDQPANIAGRSVFGRRRSGDAGGFAGDVFNDAVYMEALLGYYEHGWAQSRAVRDLHYKWIHSPRPELYSIAVDPAELVNLADVQTGRQGDGQQFLGELADADQENEDAQLEHDADALQRLQGLGYVFPSEVPEYDERMDPKDALVFFNRMSMARNLITESRWDEALPLLEDIVDALPGDQGAARLLTNGYLREGRVDDARDVAVRVIEAVSPALRPGALTLLAHVERQAGELDKALQLLHEALTPGTYEATILEQLVSTYLQSGDTDSAREYANRLVRDHSERASTWLTWSRVLMRTGPLDELFAAVERAYAIDPKNATANLLLGQYALDRREFDDAVAYLQRALKTDQTLADAYVSLGSAYYLQREFEVAKAYYRQAVRLRPDFLPWRQNLALVDMAEGRWADAVDRLRELEAGGMKNAGLYNNLAYSLRQLGRSEEARDYWRRALELNPKAAEVHHNLGLMALEEGDLAGAERNLGRALQLSPNNNELAATWSRVLLMQGRHDEALAQLEPLYERFPEDTGVLMFLGRARALSGDTAEAEKLLKNALLLSPTDGLLHFYLAELYDQLDDPEKALTHYRAAIKGGGITALEFEQVQSRLAALEEELLFAPVPGG